MGLDFTQPQKLSKPILSSQTKWEQRGALPTSSSEAYAAPSSSLSSAVLSTIADAPLDAAGDVGSLVTCAFFLSTPSQALSTAWRI